MPTTAPASPMQVPTGPALPRWARALAASVPVAATAVIGALATGPEIAGWYAGLTKPAFNPPDAAFPVAWTILDALMIVSLWRLLGARPKPGPARSGWRLAARRLRRAAPAERGLDAGVLHPPPTRRRARGGGRPSS